jgi:hypothetical protein
MEDSGLARAMGEMWDQIEFEPTPRWMIVTVNGKRCRDLVTTTREYAKSGEMCYVGWEYPKWWRNPIKWLQWRRDAHRDKRLTLAKWRV